MCLSVVTNLLGPAHNLCPDDFLILALFCFSTFMVLTSWICHRFFSFTQVSMQQLLVVSSPLKLF